MRFSSSFLFSTLFVILTATAVFFYIQFFTSNDQHVQIYKNLMSESNPSLSGQTLTSYNAKQKRENSHKHLWLASEQGPLQHCIRSNESELELDRREESTQLIEHMRNVQCYMQEELYYLSADGEEIAKDSEGYFVFKNTDTRILNDATTLKPMQIIRHMQADSASYFYKNDKLVANHVTISRFVVPGHELVVSLDNGTPLMSGIAESMECTLDGGDPQFHATQFKAILHKK